jgi:hypothetical protein
MLRNERIVRLRDGPVPDDLTPDTNILRFAQDDPMPNGGSVSALRFHWARLDHDIGRLEHLRLAEPFGKVDPLPHANGLR